MGQIILKKTTPDKIIREGYTAWSFIKMFKALLSLGLYKVGEERISGKVLNEVSFDFDAKQFVENTTESTNSNLTLSVSED